MTEQTIRKQAQKLLEKQGSIDVLPRTHSVPYDEILGHAGAIPFRIKDGQISFYLTKPKARLKDDENPPKYQIPKGTRQIWDDTQGQFIDFKDSKNGKYTKAGLLEKFGEKALEEVYINGLREGIEETGLRRDAVKNLYSFGVSSFESSSKPGVTKYMHLLAVQVDDLSVFSTPAEKSVKNCRWLSLSDRSDKARIRADHLPILEELEQSLIKHLGIDKQKAKS